MIRGKLVLAFTYSIFLGASLLSLGFALAGFSKTDQSHQLLQFTLLPQYQYALEMERAAQRGEDAAFLQARTDLLESAEPDQLVEWIEAISRVPKNPTFVKEQILPQVKGRIIEVQNQQRRYLDQVWIGFLAAVLFSLGGFGGLAAAYWKKGEQDTEWEGFYHAVLPPAHRLSMALGQFGESSSALREQTEQMVKQSGQVIELSDQLQGPMNQVEGVLGLVNDTTGAAARTAAEMAHRLKQTQDKLMSALMMLRGLTERTERMRVLAEGLSDLADQANLFLVNTSIEMARQGNGGRGFSAVAEEVNNLADGSVKTCQELIQLIRQVNEDVSGRANSLEQEIGAFGAAHQMVAKTDQSFTDLSRMVDHLCGQAGVIQKKFQQFFLESRSLKENTRELAQLQVKWQQWLAVSRESMGQITGLLSDQQVVG